MLLAHKIQLYPTVAQARYLRQCMGARRYAYNALLAHFSQDGVKWSKWAAYDVFMTKVRQPWMADVTSRAPRNAIDDLHRAYDGFFRRVKAGKRPYGYPKFQKRGQRDRFHCGKTPSFGSTDAADNLEHEAYGLLIYQPHSLPADLKCALEMDQTCEVVPQRTIDKDRREEVYPDIMVDF